MEQLVSVISFTEFMVKQQKLHRAVALQLIESSKQRLQISRFFFAPFTAEVLVQANIKYQHLFCVCFALIPTPVMNLDINCSA